MKKLIARYRAWRDARALAKALVRRVEPLLGNEPKRKKDVHGLMAAVLQALDADDDDKPQHKKYDPPKGVIPAAVMAADWAGDPTDYAWINSAYANTAAGFFFGYPRLSQLAVLPEYRKIVGTVAEEMCRRWIKLKSVGDDDKTETIDKINAALVRFNVRRLFQTMAEQDGFYGRGGLYINVKPPSNGVPDEQERRTILLRSPQKITKGSLVGFRAVEPFWTYPGPYNSTDPMSPTFYRPDTWYVMGRQYHASRLLRFVSDEVPDMLKASYNFGGVSMIQQCEPYVNNWLRTRDSTSDLVHSFSMITLKTDLSSILSGDATGAAGAASMVSRLKMFNKLRDNMSAMLLDKDSEEVSMQNVPLSGLDKLQAQAQEGMAIVPGIPLVKLLGVTPSGLNASSDGEIRVYYDKIHAKQENLFREHLTTVIEIIQLSELGAIDPDITFDFEPLWTPDAKESAEIRKIDADTDAVLTTAGVVSPDEARDRLKADPGSPYQSLEGDAPEPPDLDLETDPDGNEDSASNPA